MDPRSIPVVDLGGASAAEEVLAALSTFGFFFVRGHGVPESVLAAGMHQARCFFALREDEKRAYMARKQEGEPPLGYSGKTIMLDPGAQSQPDTREQYKVGNSGYAEAYMRRDSSRASLRPPPEAPYWPEREIAAGRLPADFKAALCEYFDAMRGLGHRLMRAVCAALGAAYAPTFDDAGEGCAFHRPMHLLSLLRYDGTVSDVQAALFGCGPHTDYGCLTILQVDPSVGGLEVCVDKTRREEELTWLRVEPVEGCLVVNAGEMLERWSNGIINANLHRVVSTSGAPRYSLPFFFEPNIDCVVEPLGACVSADRPARYEAIRFCDYLSWKFESTNEAVAVGGPA